jgi:TonB family protein
MGGKDLEPLEFLAHYKDPRRIKPLEYLSFLLSVLGHFLVIYLLVVNPHWLFYPLRYILSAGVFSTSDEGEGPLSQGRMVTFLANNRPMYAPVLVSPKGNLYSAQETVAISRPPGGRRGGNELPYSRGTTKEFTITEIAKQMPSSKTQKSSDSSQTKQETTRPGLVGAPPTLNLPPEVKTPNPATLVAPPNSNQPPEKIGSPKGDSQEALDAAAAAQQASLKPPADSTLRLDEQKQKIFDNEESALRSEGTGFFDTKGFELSDYSQFVIDRIKQNWMIPAAVRQGSGRSTVVFYIEKDGQISRMRLVAASGVALLDRAALNSILESLPFPPLPTRFPGEHVGAKLVFSYNEGRDRN